MSSGSIDERAAFVCIQSGAGGVEALDWARMLLDMHRRWAEREGLTVRVLGREDAEPTGLKTASIAIDGAGVYRRLRTETGVHQIVRVSPFDTQGRRATAFASVTVTPQLHEADVDAVELSEADLRLDVFRSDPGQRVNPAVRVTHLPTGLVFVSRERPTQVENRDVAMELLRSHLWVQQQGGDGSSVGAVGGVRRIYTLHPVAKVDEPGRSITVSNVHDVLDGDLAAFVEP